MGKRIDMKSAIAKLSKLSEIATGMDALLVMTVQVPASKEVLEVRLAERLAERDLRDQRRGLSDCLSDQWLLRDISILQAAVKEAQ